MEKIEFKDNTSTTPNRRRLKIIDNTNPLDMLVDIEHLDESKDGSLINAQLLQRLEDNIQLLSQKIDEIEEENKKELENFFILKNNFSNILLLKKCTYKQLNYQ